MDTISRILGPSIALSCPLVGSSLASDWVRFSKSNRLFDNVWPSRGGILAFCFLDSDVLPMCMYNKGNEHYQQDSKALHHTFASTCWRFSCLRLGPIFEIEPAVQHNVSPKHGAIQPLSFLYIGNSLMYMYIKGQWTLSAPL